MRYKGYARRKERFRRCSLFIRKIKCSLWASTMRSNIDSDIYCHWKVLCSSWQFQSSYIPSVLHDFNCHLGIFDVHINLLRYKGHARRKERFQRYSQFIRKIKCSIWTSTMWSNNWFWKVLCSIMTTKLIHLWEVTLLF